MISTDIEKVHACARAGHEMNRLYCIALGDNSQPTWEKAEGWQRNSALFGARGVLAGNDAEMTHESWMADRLANGWKYGVVKDIERKEHPCLVPYGMLPTAQKRKDDLFVATVRAMAVALGLEATP